MGEADNTTLDVFYVPDTFPRSGLSASSVPGRKILSLSVFRDEKTEAQRD
jgi:hypothetical protein